MAGLEGNHGREGKDDPEEGLSKSLIARFYLRGLTQDLLYSDPRSARLLGGLPLCGYAVQLLLHNGLDVGPARKAALRQVVDLVETLRLEVGAFSNPTRRATELDYT